MRRLDDRLREARERLDRLAAVADQGAAPAAAPALRDEAPPREVPLGGHVVFVPSTDGYELVDRAGPPPSPGDVVETPGAEGAYVVTKVGRSPLPGDDRPCAYLVEA